MSLTTRRSPRSAWVGWDVGGAHLKAAIVDDDGRALDAFQVPCALWRGPAELEHALARALERVDAAKGGAVIAAHALTMTGELADCYPSRDDGVRSIVRQVGERLRAPASWFAGPRGFLDAAELERDGAARAAVASMNWWATAAWVAGRLGDAIVLDVGSTTTDIVPLAGGIVAAAADDDAGRLAAGELVYGGVVRTPVMALARSAPFGGRASPLMAELFATAADVYRLTGELDERHDQHPAAAGGPKTAAGSARRLARMLGRDLEAGTIDAWRGVARAIRDEQLAQLVRAVRLVESRGIVAATAPLVAAGCGAFLAGEVGRRVGRGVVGFASLLDAGGAEVDAMALAQCAPALATALLARGIGAPRR